MIPRGSCDSQKRLSDSIHKYWVKWTFTGFAIHKQPFGKEKKKNLKTFFPIEMHNHLCFFPPASIWATSSKSHKYLFILKHVSSTNEVNGITHILKS